MKRLILSGLLITAVLLAVAGCARFPLDRIPSEPVFDGGAVEMPLFEHGLWLKGGEVTITNLYPGYTGEMEFEVGNGSQEDTVKEVRISVEPEDDHDLGDWEQLPAEYYGWFEIDNPIFTLQPGESQTVTVTVSMPEDADYSQKKARCELLVMGWSVVDTTTNEWGETVNVCGNVPIGIASEWYIETY